jgi:hypothetical protein
MLMKNVQGTAWDPVCSGVHTMKRPPAGAIGIDFGVVNAPLRASNHMKALDIYVFA